MTSIVSHRRSRLPAVSFALALSAMAAGASYAMAAGGGGEGGGGGSGAIKRARHADRSDDLRQRQGLGRQELQVRRQAHQRAARSRADRIRLRAREGGTLPRGA